MKSDFVETIPAWRIAKLRAALIEAQQRGEHRSDDGEGLDHRALRRRFALGRSRHGAARPSRAKRTRKGKAFPIAKQVAIWRAILKYRPADWRTGDKAPFGSIKRAHSEAAEDCRAIGLAPPRYRTVSVLWHRGKMSDRVEETLKGERAS